MKYPQDDPKRTPHLWVIWFLDAGEVFLLWAIKILFFWIVVVQIYLKVSMKPTIDQVPEERSSRSRSGTSVIMISNAHKGGYND